MRQIMLSTCEPEYGVSLCFLQYLEFNSKTDASHKFINVSVYYSTLQSQVNSRRGKIASFSKAAIDFFCYRNENFLTNFLRHVQCPCST